MNLIVENNYLKATNTMFPDIEKNHRNSYLESIVGSVVVMYINVDVVVVGVCFQLCDDGHRSRQLGRSQNIQGTPSAEDCGHHTG